MTSSFYCPESIVYGIAAEHATAESGFLYTKNYDVETATGPPQELKTFKLRF